MEIALPPKSEHATYDPPVLGHLGMRPELVVPDPTDERVWVEIEPNVWFRPLFFDFGGQHIGLIRLAHVGQFSRDLRGVLSDRREFSAHIEEPLIGQRLVEQHARGVDDALSLGLRHRLRRRNVLPGDVTIEAALAGRDNLL